MLVQHEVQDLGRILDRLQKARPAALEVRVDLGLQGDPSGALAAPLPVIRVDDLEAAFDAVTKAGGVIAKAIFSFPGGRRFHFIDPSGSELAVWQSSDEH